ncbi:uncharacterized protein [Ptychodera flava]|uniref:uncharacterized protein n=1 Tax=Ptychodera flava TaxID=63121 RepID=UPI00396A90A9
MSSGELITVMVKYSRGGNALPFKCSASDTIFDLANDIKSKADQFDLEEKDIKLNKIEIFIRSEDGSKKSFHFGEEIGVLKSREVEFDNHPTEYANIPVKYKDSVNPTKLQIESSKDACDFVEIILDNLDKFRLSEEDLESIKAPGNEIRLLRSTGNDEYQPISPMTRVAQIADGIIEFEVVTADMKRLGKPIMLSVTSKESSITVQFKCRENDKVHNMVELIKENIDQFQLPPEAKDAISDRSKEIILSPIPSKKGAFVGILNSFQKLGELKDENLQFEIVERRKPPSIEELAELCVGQKIAIFGAVGHGKSSTINTIARAFPGVQDSIAETSGGQAAGTQVVSPHAFKVRNKLFHLIDIPGGGLPVSDTEDGKVKLRKLTTWIINGNFPEDLPTTYWDNSNIFTGWYRYSTSKHIGKVDAIVIVHNGNATIDRLTSTVSDVAMSKGRGIPVFGIITHIDKLNDEEEIRKQVTALSSAANIDENAIYPLSNIQEGPASSQQGGRDRDEYVLCMLRSILSRSKRSMSKQHVELK